MYEYEFKITTVSYEGQHEEQIKITAKNMNAAYRPLLKAAKRYDRVTGKVADITKIEFWQAL